MASSFDHITLRTPRLDLRPLRHADAPALYEIFSDPQVCRYLVRGGWTHIDDAHQRISRDINGMASGEYLRLALVRREDAQLVGECCLFNLVAGSRRAEIGYAQARRAWGSGYMNEGLRALVECAFGTLDLNRIEADIDPRNAASARALERLGFAKEGSLRERWIVNGEVCDTTLYGLLRRDWQQTSAATAVA